MSNNDYMNIEKLEERIAETRRLLETGGCGRCARGVAMAQEEIGKCEAEIARLKGKTSNVQ